MPLSPLERIAKVMVEEGLVKHYYLQPKYRAFLALWSGYYGYIPAILFNMLTVMIYILISYVTMGSYATIIWQISITAHFYLIIYFLYNLGWKLMPKRDIYLLVVALSEFFSIAYLSIHLACTLLTFILPEKVVKIIFSEQLRIVKQHIIQAHYTTPTAYLTAIFINNLKLGLKCFLAGIILGYPGGIIVTLQTSIAGVLFAYSIKETLNTPYLLNAIITWLTYPFLEILAYYYFTWAGCHLFLSVIAKEEDIERHLKLLLTYTALALYALFLSTLVETYLTISGLTYYPQIIKQ